MARAVDLLMLLAQHGASMRLSEISAELQIPKTTVLDICRALVAGRLLERDANTGGYRLGAGILMLSEGYLRNFDVIGEFHHLVGTIDELEGETVQLALPDGKSMLYVARRDGDWPVQLTSGIGKRLPASCAAAGLATLAELEDAEIESLYASREDLTILSPHSPATLEELRRRVGETRRTGVAVDDGAVVEGVMCLGAVVRGPQNHTPVAALSVTVVKARATDELTAGWGEGIRRLAELLSARLRGPVAGAQRGGDRAASGPGPLHQGSGTGSSGPDAIAHRRRTSLASTGRPRAVRQAGAARLGEDNQ